MFITATRSIAPRRPKSSTVFANVESVLLAGAGGVLGLALGASGVRGLLLLVPGNIPRVTTPDGSGIVIPPLDWRVVVFTMALAVLTGIAFGLFPRRTEVIGAALWTARRARASSRE